MTRVAVVQFEAYSCPYAAPGGYDIVVYPVSTCPPPSTQPEATLLMPRGSHIEVYEGGLTRTYPCGSVIEAHGKRLLALCTIEPCVKCEGVDAVVAATLWWSRPGEALREARRLTYLLMTLSYMCGAPVFFANLSGAHGGRVYTGRSGIYDYRLGAPLALGGVGEGRIGYRLR